MPKGHCTFRDRVPLAPGARNSAKHPVGYWNYPSTWNYPVPNVDSSETVKHCCRIA